MNANVGGMDRVLRVAAGVALLAMAVVMEGNARWFGLIGIVPLATGLLRWCPLYTLFGFNTCPLAGRKA